MKRAVKSISFLINGERIVVNADSAGMFPLPVSKITNGQVRTKSMSHTEMDVVTNRVIKGADPV